MTHRIILRKVLSHSSKVIIAVVVAVSSTSKVIIISSSISWQIKSKCTGSQKHGIQLMDYHWQSIWSIQKDLLLSIWRETTEPLRDYNATVLLTTSSSCIHRPLCCSDLLLLPLHYYHPGKTQRLNNWLYKPSKQPSNKSPLRASL